MKRSKYRVDSIRPDAILLQDENGDVSVTNDAEKVCEEIVREFGNRRIFYIDSMGNRDELIHDNGKFIRFAPARSEEVDIRKPEFASRFILAALASIRGTPEFQEKFINKGSVVNVKMTINDIQVPVIDVLADIWQRMNDEIEQRAKKRAKQIINETGMNPLIETLREAQQHIEFRLGLTHEH